LFTAIRSKIFIFVRINPAMKKSHLILLIFILIKLVLQFYAIHPVYELHRDEFLHLDLGKHLDWGYLTVPPLTGLFSRVILLLGGSVFWVKFFPAVMGVLLIVVVWETVRVLNGGIGARLLAATGITFSTMVRINSLYQPNSADYLLWTLLFYLLVRYIQSGFPKWIYYSALTVAVAFLNKYNICFLLAGLVPAFLITENRGIFLRKELWAGSALALVLVMPNLVWQYANGFPVWHHLQELSGTQLVHVNRFDFLKEQLYFFPGAVPVLIAAFIAFFACPEFRRYRVFLWGMVFTLAVFTAMRAKNYYAVGLYPVMIAFGAVYLEKKFLQGRRKWVFSGALLFPVVLYALLFPGFLPVWTPEEIFRRKDFFDRLNLTRWEDGRLHDLPQDFSDMQGWKEMAHLADSAYHLVSGEGKTIVHCDNYGQAGAVNYYTKVPGLRAYTMNADYINWYPLGEPGIVNTILIKDTADRDPDREREKRFFEDVRLIGQVTNRWAREKGTRVYLLRKAKVSVNEILKREIAERKEKMRIK
jgi:hypothetical protein